MFIFAPIFIGLRNSVPLWFPPLRLSNQLLVQGLSLVNSDVSFIYLSSQCHCGSPSSSIICRCGGDTDSIADPVAVLPPDGFIFPVNFMLTTTYIYWVWGLLLHVDPVAS